MEIIHSLPLVHLLTTKCMQTWLGQIGFCLCFFFFLHYFLVLIHFVVTICFMRTRLCFDYLSVFKVIWETKTRERNRGWERKNNFLLSWEFFLRMNIDLEFLHVKRATVATLKKKLELERLLEGVFCVFTLQNWL